MLGSSFCSVRSVLLFYCFFCVVIDGIVFLVFCHSLLLLSSSSLLFDLLFLICYHHCWLYFIHLFSLCLLHSVLLVVASGFIISVSVLVYCFVLVACVCFRPNSFVVIF